MSDPPYIGMRTTKLSPKQTEIARWLIQGYTNNEISRRTRISPDQVRRHVSVMLLKGRARNRTHLVTRMLQAGLLDPEHYTREDLPPWPVV